jgi:hypothetical protein
MVEKDKAQSGSIPSSAIPAIMWAISQNANSISSLWKKVKKMDTGLREIFEANIDSLPTLEGLGDGLLVISWDHKCIESFQAYQPLKLSGTVSPHRDGFLDESSPPIEYILDDAWSIIDHHFEESRH